MVGGASMMCIYAITNTKNGKCYIGSSKEWFRRRKVHIAMLRRGTHHSPHLQRAWDRDGASTFQFQPLEILSTTSELITQEQWWMDLLRPEYNIRPTANPMGGRLSPETRAKISAAKKGKPSPKRGTSLSEEQKDKIRASLVGRKRPPEVTEKITDKLRGRTNGPLSDERRAKISAAKIGRKLTAEHRAALSAAQIERWRRERASH